jgi:Lon protease-like protein
MLPLFPLPNVVLFPRAYLPLHIFEHRYRAMVRDALDGRRTIGMVVLREGWQTTTGLPPVYATGCAGEIVHHDALPDGRFNIVLRGTRKFRIREERLVHAYREADVEWLDEPLDVSVEAGLRAMRRRLDALLLPALARGEARMPTRLADDELVNAVSQALDIDVVEKLALLEKPDVLARAEAVMPIIIERRLVQGTGDDVVH